MQQFSIVCESLTGNTMMLAEALRSQVLENTPILTPEQATDEQAAICFVGSWTDKGDCGAATAQYLEHLHGKKVFLFGTCGFCDSQSYYDAVYRRFAAHVGMDNEVIGHFFCQGRMQESVLRRFEAMLAANPECARWAESIENYNKALCRPNGRDLRELCDAAQAAILAE